MSLDLLSMVVMQLPTKSQGEVIVELYKLQKVDFIKSLENSTIIGPTSGNDKISLRNTINLQLTYNGFNARSFTMNKFNELNNYFDMVETFGLIVEL